MLTVGMVCYCQSVSSSLFIIVLNNIIILTAASDGLFFNQTSIPSRMMFLLDTPNTPIVSITLLVEKNLINNGSLQVFHYHNFIWNNHHISTPQLNTNFRVDVDEQLLSAEQYVWSIVNVMNATECFNGTHTFLFVPVNIYITNITGQLFFHLRARIHNQWTGYQYYSYTGFTARIKNGT